MTMDHDLSAGHAQAAHWARVRSALADCLELAGPERQAFIERLRETEPEVAAEVRELAALDDQTSSVLDRPPGELLDAPDAEHRLEGARLGAYRIVRRIASGGMGDVFLGERADGAFQMQVAVKLLRDGLVNDADIARFERERQILANLEHVNLVKILDGGVTAAGLPYFVMELVDGVPLDEHCCRSGATLPERIALLRKVCEVVHYVNQRGIVHRDLKPRNILVTPAGVVKLLDFGIATRLPDPSAAVEQTRTALRGMTLLYASPEQIRGDPVGPESDVYALGVVMVRLLAGGQPYAVDPSTASSFEFAKEICDGEPRRMSELVPDGPGAAARRRALRGDLDAIAAKALRKDRASRYASASELDDDLFRHLSLVPVQARRGAVNYRFGRWLLKNRALAGAAIVSNLVLLVGITITLAQVHEARIQRERAHRNFASLRTLTNDFLFDLHDAIASLPGSRPARKLVVDKAQVYLRTLADDAAGGAGDDRAVDLDMGVSYRKLGDLQAMPTNPNLGDPEGALANYAKSIALLQELAKGGPEANPARLELAHTWLSKASVLSYNAHFVEAEQALHPAEAVLADLRQRLPDDLDVQQMQAQCYGALGWVRHERSDLAAFEKYAGMSEALLEKVLAARPDRADTLYRLQVAYARRTSSYLDRDNTPESARLSLAYAEKWRDVGQRLLAREPANPRYRAVLAEADEFIGAASERLGDSKRAAEAVGQGLVQLAEELRLDPNDDAALDMMVNLQVTLAKTLLDEHEPAASREHATQALAFHARRSEASQANSYNLLAAAQAHHLMAHAWLQQGQRAKTCSEFDASMALVRRIKEMPQPSGDAYDIGEAAREAAACRSGTRIPDTTRSS